jgi:hypothetical protein
MRLALATITGHALCDARSIVDTHHLRCDQLTAQLVSDVLS